MKPFYFSFIFILALSACQNSGSSNGASASSNGIVGGRDVPAQDPLRKNVFLVLAFEKGSLAHLAEGRAATGKWRCTGTLISNRYVVTAAHCVTSAKEPNGVDLAIYLDDYDPATPIDLSKLVLADDSRFQPGYKQDENGTTVSDIGLIRLAKPLGAPFAPAPILPDNALDKDSPLTAAGFGGDHTRNNRPLLFLRAANPSLIAFKNAALQITVTHTDQSSIEHGDSGGPLFAFVGGKQRLVGVASASLHEINSAFLNGKEVSKVETDSDAYEDIRHWRKWLNEAAHEMGLELGI